ncbi:Poor homologous synapsis [Thalictrum thalictroides]|uniref:Poor homologous synapsis n=1 Tax=Thalictrum thalictroides TaxID=46969 RepID=A0A7J6XD25_THATH|nr:Poor homologous synapsis [Thalictrum thalictroides]
MAGNLSIVPAQNFQNSLTTAIKNNWEIHYARFFNFPRSLSTSCAMLRPLPKSRFRTGGNWISTSSTVTLNITRDFLNPELILVVSRPDMIVEEHFTCNLQFSWPQVSCVTECPTRGSRVVFASYIDCDGQKQKFALRFPTSCDAETFIGALKESLKDAKETGVLRSNFESEISAQSEFLSSNGQQFSAEELDVVDPVATYSPQTASLLEFTGRLNGFSKESLPGHNFERICEAELPPSFTALLSNCSPEGEVKQEHVKVPEEIDLKSQIMKYLSDASFHGMWNLFAEVLNHDVLLQFNVGVKENYKSENIFHVPSFDLLWINLNQVMSSDWCYRPNMLAKVEEVISEMGGDLAF